MKTVTIDDVMAWSPCGRYDREAVSKLFGRRKRLTGKQILALKIPAEDRLWVALKGPWLDDRKLRLFACDCAEKGLPIWEREHPDDKRPRQTIEVARRFARGEATNEELAAAGAAACAAAGAAACAAAGAAAWDAAGDAAWDAAGAAACAAAGDAAWDAAGDAAWDAAGAAAGAAACAAARDAACAAARDAAWDAAGDEFFEWELTRLGEYMTDAGEGR